MTPQLEALIARLNALQEEMEDAYRQAREEWEQQKTRLAGEFQRTQRRYRVGLLRFLRTARPLFFDSDDAVAFRQGLKRLRRQYEQDQPRD